MPRKHNIQLPPRSPSPLAPGPNAGRVANVVDAYNVTAGVLATALQPCRHYPEVAAELTQLYGRSA